MVTNLNRLYHVACATTRALISILIPIERANAYKNEQAAILKKGIFTAILSLLTKMKLKIFVKKNILFPLTKNGT